MVNGKNNRKIQDSIIAHAGWKRYHGHAKLEDGRGAGTINKINQKDSLKKIFLQITSGMEGEGEAEVETGNDKW